MLVPASSAPPNELAFPADEPGSTAVAPVDTPGSAATSAGAGVGTSRAAATAAGASVGTPDSVPRPVSACFDNSPTIAKLAALAFSEDTFFPSVIPPSALGLPLLFTF